MQALQRQAPVAGKSWREWVLQLKAVRATPLRPEFWTWENILRTFGNDIDRATQQKLEQLPPPFAADDEYGAAPAISAAASNLSGALWSNAGISDPAQSWSARFSADLLRPATPRAGVSDDLLVGRAPAGALTLRTHPLCMHAVGESVLPVTASLLMLSGYLSLWCRRQLRVWRAGRSSKPCAPSRRWRPDPDPDAIGDDGNSGADSGTSDGTRDGGPPTPEPSTWEAAALALVAVGYTERRRLRALAVRLAARRGL